MLSSLHIKNLLLIDSAELEFGRSFNVITGETGAGKSILLDCLSLCLGEKNNNVGVRKGADKGSVTAQFDIGGNSVVAALLQEVDAEGDELVIRRTVTTNGKTQAYVNDEPVSLNFLKKLAGAIVEIYGQHDYSALMNRASHVDLLDRFGAHDELIDDVKAGYEKLHAVLKQLAELRAKADEAAREEEFIKFVVGELGAFNPQQGEEQELAEKRILMQQSAKITDTLVSAHKQISGSDTLQNIYSAQKTISKLSATLNDSTLTPKLQDIHNMMERAAIELEEAANKLDELNSGDFDSAGLEALEDRLFGMREMARKYRKQPDELATYLAELQEKMSLINSFDDILKEHQQKLEAAEQEYLKDAQKLSAKRKRAAEKLEKEVNVRLPELKMEGAKFKVSLEEKMKDEWNAQGIDRVTFTASTNPGQPFDEVGKVASGGELSRMMLALKVALSNTRSTACVIFDEIDTGIGGATAEAVGISLAQLGDNVQVISITHQPQVASKAKEHFVVQKELGKNDTRIHVRKLSDKESNEEVARMLSGENVTKEARAAALKLKVVS